LLLFLLLVAGGVGGYFLYRAAKHQPQAYEKIREIDPEEAREQIDELERRILDMRNDASRRDRWSLVITARQINAYLTREEVEAHLPENVHQPRVLIAPDRLTIFCRYEGQPLSSVLWLESEIFLTDEPNTIGIWLRKARAGNVPLPLSQVIQEMNEAANEYRIPLRWGEKQGRPIALVKIPSTYKDLDHEVKLETLKLVAGGLHLGGTTDTPEGARRIHRAALLPLLDNPEQSTIQR